MIGDMTPEDFTKEWEAARAFDESLTQNNLYGDVFGEDKEELQNTDTGKYLTLTKTA